MKHLAIKLAIAITCIFTTAYQSSAQQTKYGIVNSGELIKQGIELHDQEKYDEAIKMYSQVPENDTNYILAIVEKALSVYAQKDYEKTIALCEQAMALGNSYDHSLYITMGSAYDDAGKPEKAIETYDKGLKEFPKNHLILFNKGVTLQKQEKFDDAIATYKQVLQISPYHASTHYRLGNIAEQEGDLTRAMLCYNAFLLVEPTTERALNVLQSLDRMIAKKYDDTKAKGIVLAQDGEDFSEIETIIRKQLALNKSYKLESKADFPVTRQNQALLSYLATHKGKQGFWETFYVPFFAQLYKEGHFEGFSYYILASSDNEKIRSMLVKNKGDIAKFNEWQEGAFIKVTSRRTQEIDGKPTNITQTYYKTGKLYGVGPYLGDAEKLTGAWQFYYTTGKLMSKGSFDSNGEQTGEWVYYHTNGKPKKETTLSAGKENGAYKMYYANGNLKESGTFSAGQLNNEIKTYTWYGALEEVHHFKNGVHEGKYEDFYPNGKLRFISAYANNKLSGTYKRYHPNGALNIDGNVKDDLKEGPFTVYFDDTKIELKKTYLQNKETGAFVKYYNNGKVKQEGEFKNDKPVGPWKLYYRNGQLDEITTYNDNGNEEGKQQYFDTDGKLYYEAEYKNGRMTQFKFIDKTGQVLADTKLKAKQDIKTYYAEGMPRWSGAMENGKRNGLWKEYTRDGLLASEYNYDDGVLTGKAKVYFKNGKVYKDLNYKKGNLHGEYREYFSNGQLFKSAWYEDGDGFGDVNTYTNTGLKDRFYTLFKGKVTGINYNYDIEGKLNVTEKYDDGYFTGFTFYDTSGKVIKIQEVKKEKAEAEFPTITGQTHIKRTFISGSKEGPSFSYYLDNKIESEGTFLNDERQGAWKWFNPDNTLSLTKNYRNGEAEGTNENFDLFGKLKARYEYADGNIYGTGEIFYYSGTKKEEVSYWAGDEHGPTKYFGFNGEHVMTLLYNYGTLSKVVYVNGKGGKPDTVAAPVNGTIESKYANGKTAFLIEYKNGEHNGKYREFFDDGTPCREAQYTDDLLEGERKTWYRNGKLRSIESYKFNDDDGLVTLYYESGTKKAELMYKADSLHGPVKYYDSTGKLAAHYIFYNGMMIKKVL
ncbi:MAG TPA: tetratricopeptide repeat protein [Chitinophagales bacterium]|nr:tetratricopeptide repeat protein [Chitinophagales bacterium]